MSTPTPADTVLTDARAAALEERRRIVDYLRRQAHGFPGMGGVVLRSAADEVERGQHNDDGGEKR